MYSFNHALFHVPAYRACCAGKFVVVLDDEDRENEGDLIINADKVTTEAMAFMVEHTSGVVSQSSSSKGSVTAPRPETGGQGGRTNS